jgi:transcriptional regulator with XRE-family HTH domain
MSDTIDRLKQFFDNQGISIRQVEIKIGASNGVISKYIRSGSDINSKWIEKIIYEYNINPSWLFFGKGEMHAGEVQSSDTRYFEALVASKDETIKAQANEIIALKELIAMLKAQK